MLRKHIAACSVAIMLLVGTTSFVVAASPGAGDRIPIVTEFTSPCTGEVVVVEGTLNSFNPAGNFRELGHSDFHGSATSESGTTYDLISLSQVVTGRGRLDGYTNWTIVERVLFVATGEEAAGDDFMVTLVRHNTFDDDGNQVATVHISKTVCL